MQFSLRNLMAFALVVSLVLIGWVSKQRLDESDARTMQLRKELAAYTILANRGDREQDKELHERIVAAEEKRVREFSTAQAKFQAVADKYGSLDVSDPDKFLIISVLELHPSGTDRHAWRVHIPENCELRLAVNFLRQSRELSVVSSGDASRVLKQAEFYEPGEPWSVNLPKGESVIAFRWAVLREHRLFKLILDGEVIKTIKCRTTENGYSTMSGRLGAIENQVEIDPQKPLTLLRFTPEFKKEDFRESVWLQILPTGKGDSR